MLQNGRQLTQLFRSGWKIVTNNPTIGALAFITELENTTSYTQDDWVLGSASLVELGYLVTGFTWAQQRDWITGVEPEIGANIKVMLQGYFSHSPTLQIAVLTDQKNTLLARRSNVNGAITGVLDPWLDSPPPGTDNLIVLSVERARESGIKEISTIDETVAEINQRLAEWADGNPHLSLWKKVVL